MRLRVLTRPTGTIDGISLDQFRLGEVYELGTQVACLFLAEGLVLADWEVETLEGDVYLHGWTGLSR